MTAIITGDIINSAEYPASDWTPILKTFFATLGESPIVWEIYRGDEFQLKTTPGKALETAIHIKALIKSVKDLDVRMGIGVGEETFTGPRIGESNGPAYQRSGRTFERLKEEKTNLAIATGKDFHDDTLNLIIKLALDFMDDWSPVSAEIVALVLENPHDTQNQIAERLDIHQSAVSQRQKRARLDLVQQVVNYYGRVIKDF